jgi:hypothetical protein
MALLTIFGKYGPLVAILFAGAGLEYTTFFKKTV